MGLLMPLSLLYGFATRIRFLLYAAGIKRKIQFDKPVLVVGNVVAGGAGKTPLVMALVEHLTKRGLRPGVVSRGYGRRARGVLEVTPQTPIEASGDEPALIKWARGAPVFVAAKRADAVAALLRAYPDIDIVVADDGLQHYALARDIEVVVFDDRGLGNGRLLPAGPLRERWPRQHTAAATLVLHTGVQPSFAGFRSHRQLAPYAVASNGVRTSLESLKNRPLAAVAAIANPERFFDMLRASGLVLNTTASWPDHHDFADFDPINFAGTTVLCTEKDAIKLFRMPSVGNLHVLAVPLIFEPEPAFFAAFDSAFAAVRSPLPSADGYETS
jgi:tetraacyldisaccharide 4'-kinase